MTPNATINPLDRPSCKYDVIINPVEYGSKWVALEADAAPRTACRPAMLWQKRGGRST